ncbi:M-like protein [Deinococcus aestuarii]|uniref:M-like protein n=1 Tax=Deinococcus aestuarii TaxID=2774531 RepID=UPI001C0E01FC|nr:M-like protein [Deinococcus aestuarii]
MTQSDDQQLQNAPADPSVKTEDEVSNVDLQFMGRTDERRDALKDARAEARIADEFEDRGLDKQDVASSGSMITSDPASTMPGDETSEDTSQG